MIRTRGSCSLVGLKCYEDSDQSAWILQSCWTEKSWRLWSVCMDRAFLQDWNVMKTLIRLRVSCSLVRLKCYKDSDQTAWIEHSLGLKCYRTEMLWRLWSDCLDRAVLYDWNVMKNDQAAWIMQSCRTEMLWSLIRLHGSCSLVELKCYDDSDQTALIVQSCGTEIIGRLWSECVDRAVL